MPTFKSEARVLGIDDGPFEKIKDKKSKKANANTSLIIATVYRGGKFMDGVLSTKVQVDGSDSTSKLIKIINSCRFKNQLHCIFLNGIAVGGFNVINIQQLFKKTGIPVIVISRIYPDFKKIFNALTNLKMKQKIRLIQNAGPPISHKKIFFQAIGIEVSYAKNIIDATSTHSHIPEPLRIAHLIAAGVVKGESKGRA